MPVPRKEREGGVRPPPGKNLVRAWPPRMKNKVREMYLTTGLKLRVISEQTGVPISTIQQWISSGKWLQVRKQMEHDLAERSQAALEAMLQKEIGSVLQRHLEVGEVIETQVKERILEAEAKNIAYGPQDLMFAAKAFNQSAAISGGVFKNMMNSPNGKQSVNVMINTNVQPVADPNFKAGSAVIDVEEEPTEPPADPSYDDECGF